MEKARREKKTTAKSRWDEISQRQLEAKKLSDNSGYHFLVEFQKPVGAVQIFFSPGQHSSQRIKTVMGEEINYFSTIAEASRFIEIYYVVGGLDLIHQGTFYER